MIIELGIEAEEDDDDEISPDLWQEACWIVIRLR